MTRVTAPTDYIRVFDKIAKIGPQSIVLRNWLTTNVKKTEAERNRGSQLLTDECLNGTAYCTVDYIKNFVDNFPVLNLFSTETTIDRTLMTKMVRNLREYLGLNENLGFAVECTSDVWQESLKETFGDMKTMQYCIVHPFWIPFEKHSQLTKEKLVAPNGYEFDNLKTEETDLVNSLWPWKFESSDDMIRKRITSFPNSCLRVKGTGQLASFELTCSEIGYMTRIYSQW